MRLFSIIFSGSIIVLILVLFLALALLDVLFEQHAVDLNGSGGSIQSLLSDDTAKAISVLFIGGQTLGEISLAGENQQWTPIEAIPTVVQNAFIAAEDETFWSNPGIDIAANLRASVADILNASNLRPAGASTITQQLVKNQILKGRVENLSAKIDEIILALRVGSQVPKARILELYLNQIYLGEHAYGIAAAAAAYFHEPLQDITVAQAASLASLPKSPILYDPELHPTSALDRRSYVLGRMLALNMISPATYQAAIEEPLIPDGNSPHSPAAIYDVDASIPGAGWLKDVLVANLQTINLDASTPDVTTTIDENMEVAAQISLDVGLMHWDAHMNGWHGVLGHITGGYDPSALQSFDPPQAPLWSEPAIVAKPVNSSGIIALVDQSGQTIQIGPAGYSWLSTPPPLSVGDVVLIANVGLDGYQPFLMQIPEKGLDGSIIVMDAKKGALRAFAGGFSYRPGDFDRAFQASRQPGSTVKPFIYLAAMELGYTPDTPVLDLPIDIAGGSTNTYWEPLDDDKKSMGIISTREALIYSRNLAAVRVLWQVGLAQVSTLTNAFGLYDKLDDYSDALGAKAITPIKMATAYAELVNGGFRVNPSIIAAIGPEQINTTAPMQIAPTHDVDEILSILDGVTTEGTASNLDDLAEQLPIGGKTGTSDDFKDAWFAGYANHRLAIVVQVGFDKPATLGSDGFGASVAAPIFKSFVENQMSQIRALSPINVTP